MEDKEKLFLIKSWQKSALEDLEIAEDLFKLKHYSYSLFFCHLVIEKILKAIYLKKNDSYPPPIHRLTKLAKDSKIKLSKEQIVYLNEITTFNVQARYDIIKEKLYKKATKEFTLKYLKNTKELLNYLKKEL